MEQNQPPFVTENTKLLDNNGSCNYIKEKLIQYFFLISLLITVTIAWFYPSAGASGGILEPEITSGWVAVVIIFFVNGITVQTAELKNASLYWQLNIFIQFIVFLWFPFIGYMIYLIFDNDDIIITNNEPFNKALLDGLLILCCIPTTISSSIVYTQSSGGNEAAAIINATLSNVLGIILTPLLIYLLVGNLTDIEIESVVFRLSMRVIIPFLIGQVIRYIFNTVITKIVKKYKKIFKKIAEICILYIVFCANSDTFNADFEAETVEIIIMIIICIFIHIFTICFVWFISGIRTNNIDNNDQYIKFDHDKNNTKRCANFLKFDIYDRITILYCSIQKTVAFGIPIIETLYENDDNIGMYILPLLLYLPIELIVDGFFVTPLNNKAMKYKNMSMEESIDMGQSLNDEQLNDEDESCQF